MRCVAICLVAAVALASSPRPAQFVARQARTLVDELAALAWEENMQTVPQADTRKNLHTVIRLATDSDRGLEERDGDGRTALHWAAANGYQEIVDALVRAGADANSSCQYVGQTPLYMATRWARAEAVQVLLQHGADPNKSDRFGKNAFDAALAAGESRAQMEWLLRQHSSSS